MKLKATVLIISVAVLIALITAKGVHTENAPDSYSVNSESQSAAFAWMA